jgi:hypothetical protein
LDARLEDPIGWSNADILFEKTRKMTRAYFHTLGQVGNTVILRGVGGYPALGFLKG